MSNITRIRDGEDRTDAPAPESNCGRYFRLEEPDNQPSTLRVIQALHGICWAIEQLAETDNAMTLELGTAAEILSEMIQDRVMTR